MHSTELSSALKHPWVKAHTNSAADWSLHCCPTAIRRPRALGLVHSFNQQPRCRSRQHPAKTDRAGFLHALAHCLSHGTTAQASFAHLLFSCFSPSQWHSFSRSRRERPSWALGLGALHSCWGNFTEISYTLRMWEAEGTQRHRSCYKEKAKAHTSNQWVTQGINWNKHKIYFPSGFLFDFKSVNPSQICPVAHQLNKGFKSQVEQPIFLAPKLKS